MREEGGTATSSTARTGQTTKRAGDCAFGRLPSPAPHATRSSPHGVYKHNRHPRLGQPAWTLSGALGPSPSPGRGLRALFYVEGSSDIGVAGSNQRRILTWIAWTTFVSDSRHWNSRCKCTPARSNGGGAG